MTEPPTLILWEGDEERTLVDRAQLSSPKPAFAGSVHPIPSKSQDGDGDCAKREAKQTQRAWRSLLSNHRREIIEVSVSLTLLVGLGSVVHQQWRIAGALRETLAEIRAPGRDMVTVRPKGLPQIQETSKPGEVERRALIKELAADEREALERQAAALIASNDLPAALSQYETLTELFPDDRTLRDVVTVLRAKLRCDPSAGFASGACR
ncbi:MAG: hypothetical protein OER77_08900 [Myxococcales bacterium]|nr:hypothetical protein [Myxococcales bacterium]